VAEEQKALLCFAVRWAAVQPAVRQEPPTIRVLQLVLLLAAPVRVVE
jgi:hypothetical protein